jgi:small subunit ribosomal protein S15
VDASNKAETVNTYKRNEKDTGSPEVQVALLTHRIKELTDHLSSFSKDHSARRGLIMMVNKRRKLLTYVQQQDDARYKELITKLGLRR